MLANVVGLRGPFSRLNEARYGFTLDYSPLRHANNLESVWTYEGTDDVRTLILGSKLTGVAAFR